MNEEIKKVIMSLLVEKNPGLLADESENIASSIMENIDIYEQAKYIILQSKQFGE